MSIFRCGSWTLSIWWTLFVLYCFHIVVFLYFCRLEREEMLVWTKLPYLKAKWLVAMENKFWAGMCTGWDSSLIFSGCCHSISPLLVIMCALWYNECSTCNLYCLYCVISVNSLETSSQIFFPIADDCPYSIYFSLWKSISGNSVCYIFYMVLLLIEIKCIYLLYMIWKLALSLLIPFAKKSRLNIHLTILCHVVASPRWISTPSFPIFGVTSYVNN